MVSDFTQRLFVSKSRRLVAVLAPCNQLFNSLLEDSLQSDITGTTVHVNETLIEVFDERGEMQFDDEHRLYQGKDQAKL